MISMITGGVLALMLHPFHVSVAEAHWNGDASRLQVALRFTPRDLDAALSIATGQRVVLERRDTEEAKTLVRDYLRDRIYLSPTAEAAKAASGSPVNERRQRFHWVGMEQDLRYTWVYFELESPLEARGRDAAEPERVWLTNRVIFDAEPTQVNTLQLLKTDPAVAVRTTREEPTKSLPVIVTE